ncbi:hypothetical protein BLSS_0424 [Bifidobacterium longum subsp. suis]|uniref:Uncharacterized protein n=1 Tax=Bifidobacterium longum subsp. suis TaxID=1695 RepID=A0A087BRT2_BIFLN|nr:hypothetical protein BLSS_0424 [Bifidobacterium longum subsp. suis]
MCGVVLCPHGTFPFLLSPFSPSAGKPGLSIMGVDAAWVKTIKGLVVIAAVAYDLLSKKKKG